MRMHTPNNNNNNNNNNNFSNFPCFTNLLQHQQITPSLSACFSGSDRISHDPLSGVVFPASNGFTPPAGSNLSSESLSGSVQLPRFDDNNEFAEDNECDSEEREEVEIKQQTSRNQSKRGRAAEVHNLSEKRRRSRINEKMKALQNLIPNSNKTDKASMLDEVIEYLKQLQLQVQMLSLRNGLSLQPMCLSGRLHPSQLSQLGINFDNGSNSYDMNLTSAPNSTIPETSNTMLNLPNQCTSSVRPSVPIASTVIDSVSMPFGHKPCTEAVCREQGMPHERSVDNIEMDFLVTTFSRPEYNTIQERMQQKHGPQETLLKNASGQNQLISSNFSVDNLFLSKRNAKDITKIANGMEN